MKRTNRRRVGRPSKRDEPLDREETLIRLVGLGLSQTRAAQAVGIDPSTLARWKREDDEFRQRVDREAASAVGTVAGVLAQLIFGAKSEGVRLRACLHWLATHAEEFRLPKSGLPIDDWTAAPLDESESFL